MKPFSASLLAVALGAVFIPQAQAAHSITSDMSGMSAIDLANALVGGGINVTSATFTGANASGGTFTGATASTGLPFSSGVILSSGSIFNSVGPNTTESATSGWGTSGYGLLDTLSGGTTHDASVLQFHFTSDANIFSFRYAFGSEEYNEYVGSQYNDVFAFFLQGPGYETPVNLATLPDNSPISINNVNAGSNSAYYLNNQLVDGSSPWDIQLDGLVGSTIPLYASAPITAGADYTITIAVADVGDASYDTDVFLQGDSFIAQAAPPETPVPEPSTILGGVAFGGLALARALRRKKA